MNFYKNLKIANKLIIGFIIVALMSALVGIVSIVNTNSIVNSGKQQYEENILPLKPALVMQTDFLNVRVNLRSMIIAKTDVERVKYSNNIDNFLKELSEQYTIYEKYASSQVEIDNNTKLKKLIEEFNIIINQIRNLINANKIDEALDLINGQGAVISKDLDNCITVAFDVNNNQAAERQKAAEAAGTRTMFIIGGAILVAMGLAIALGIAIAKIIGKPINKLVEASKNISEGNLDFALDIKTKDEVGVLAESFEKITEALRNLIKDSNMLTQASLEGKLSTRADVSRHQGDYRKIVEGVNMTLDAVIEPVKEAATVLKEMSNGNLNVVVKGDYKGDHADIKNALNDTIYALSTYVKEISEVLKEMADSNLNVSISNQYKGDFVQIQEALNNIISSFNSVFTEINAAAGQVSSGSTQVSDGSQALSQGTTEQAASIEELTSSISDVATQTKRNAVNASEANELALKAKEGAVQGNSQMKEMLKSMDEINESSSNISKIIKVIDDIAFQTNILALNAAVEAARAGQHGKGFAVVAEEVRNLAARSANAARETTDLIEGSIRKVEYGTKIANNTAEALDQIVNGVSKAATLVGEIAVASNDQATAISQINKGIEQVSAVVQTNSATAEESAAASEELSSQAALLKNMVRKFRLKKSNFSSYSQFDLEDDMPSYSEVAVTKSKPTIYLSDREFGKY